MGHILPKWIEFWLIASTVICLIDVSYTMSRPASTRGGSLENVYYLWNIYADVDLRYATANDVTTMSTGRLMLVEIVMNIIAVIMNRQRSRHTILTTFTTTAFVFWKTAVFLMLYVHVPAGNIDYFTPGTPAWKIFIVFWVPNGIWLVVPLAILVALWNRLVLTTDSVAALRLDAVDGCALTSLCTPKHQRLSNSHANGAAGAADDGVNAKRIVEEHHAIKIVEQKAY